MGCGVSSSLPPVCFQNKGGWCPSLVCADQSYTLRHTVLFDHLSGVKDLVILVESYIPLDCPYIPLWYVYGKRKEFYQPKPRTLFGHVMWNYYARHHQGIGLYVIGKGTYHHAIWVDETRLKLQILEKHFKSERHPNWFQGFRTILKNESLLSFRLNSIADHFHFWIKKFTYQMDNFSRMYLELEGIFPVIWCLFMFILQSKKVPVSTKNQIVRFLVQNPSFCTSIQENWRNMAGDFLKVFSASPPLRFNMLIHILQMQK